jgi:hypothetical protein
MDAAEKTAIHRVTMKGVPYDLSNDNEFAVLLEDLLNSGLQEQPEALQYAGRRIKAWVRAHELVNELERLGPNALRVRHLARDSAKPCGLRRREPDPGNSSRRDQLAFSVSFSSRHGNALV